MSSETDKLPAVGIDVGTRYSCAGIFQNGRVDIIPNDVGNRTTDSAVAFTDTGRLFGDVAHRQASYTPRNTVHNATRLLGRSFCHPSIQTEAKYSHFEIIRKENDRAAVKVDKGGCRQISPEQLYSMILTEMKELSSAFCGKEVNNAVFAVSSIYNSRQKQAVNDAATIAGLNVARFIPTSAAAAVGYGLDKTTDKGEKNVLVFDLVGGTFIPSKVVIACKTHVQLEEVGKTLLQVNKYNFFVAPLV